ncbi:hypothetical protein [Burkholderia latens]|uniref:Uncharacterized protein n=1 Tax=Burkholderia latens TaxID=488446 RepID=A0A6H9TI13_9BURK|nr:hypothetical protein [Burkholderia latens]KAB0643485.1 hypothetical protein F7R21_07340 [Burkholderia latens]
MLAFAPLVAISWLDISKSDVGNWVGHTVYVQKNPNVPVSGEAHRRQVDWQQQYIGIVVLISEFDLPLPIFERKS